MTNKGYNMKKENKKVVITAVDPDSVSSELLERLSEAKYGTIVWDDVTKH
jgi:hypothetical protein